MGRHAYLILAHEYSEVLWTLLSLLDDEQNDIYVHMDKKNKESMPQRFFDVIHKSKLFIFSKIKVFWGTNSLTLAELVLLKKAVKNGPYDYYHMLSGADLPIKKKEYIKEWFVKNNGKEFIHFGTEQYQRDIESRYMQYHFFEKKIGRLRDKPFWIMVETYSQAIQRRLHVNRVKNCKIKFYGGSNWFSITDGLAKEILNHYKRNKKYYRFTMITDELLFQTAVMNSAFAKNLYNKELNNDYSSCVRHIDWNRGNPYVWKRDDFKELINSPALFARKFDCNIDREIVDKIYNKLK